MGSFCDYLEDKVIDHVTNVAAFSVPTNLYIGLSTTTPTDAGGNITEPATGDNYARVVCNSWNTAASRTTSNTNVVTFNQCTTTNWGDITHWFVSDNGTRASGNYLAWGALAATKTVVIGNTPSFAAGELDVTFDASGAGGGFTTFLANEILDHVFKVGSWSAPSSLAIALFTVTPSDSGGGTECTGNNYARKTHSAWSASSGGATSNSSAITFNTPSGTWGTVVACGAFDATTNLLIWGNVTDQAVGSGDTVDFPTGDFDISLS
jgi:hypothetical protein